MREMMILFDETCVGWSNNPKMNQLYIKHVEEHLNDRLHNSDWVCLNDLYCCLGMRRLKIGQIYGWINDGKTAIHLELYPTDNGNIEIIIRDLDNLLV